MDWAVDIMAIHPLIDSLAQMDTIVTLDLVEITAEGERLPIRIEIGRPQPNGLNDWACSIWVKSVDDEMRNVFGADSLQALILGLRLVGVHLGSILKQGSRLIDPKDEKDFPLQIYFKD